MNLSETIISPMGGHDTAHRKPTPGRVSFGPDIYHHRAGKPIFDGCDYMPAGEKRDPIYFGRISADHAVAHKCLEHHFRRIEEYL
jgi:hypothetical protein